MKEDSPTYVVDVFVTTVAGCSQNRVVGKEVPLSLMACAAGHGR